VLQLDNGDGTAVSGLFPQQPEPPVTCKCGKHYDASGYVVQQASCTVYLETPHLSKTMPLYCLQCPDKNPACTILYDGTFQGIFRINNHTAVSLRMLYKCFDAFRRGGYSAAAFVADMQADYIGDYSDPDQMGEPTPFLSENTFRSVFFVFCASISRDLKFCCSICKDCPRIIIADGTRVLMWKRFFSGKPITERSEQVLDGATHRRAQRAFIDDRLEPKARKAMRGLLKKLGESIQNKTRDKEVVEFTDEDWDALVEDSRLFFMDCFFTQLRGTLETTSSSMLAGHKAALGQFLANCLATDSPTISYFDYRLVEPVRHILDHVDTSGGHAILDKEVLALAREFSPLFWRLLQAAGASDTFPLTNGYFQLVEQLCKRSALCAEGPGAEDLWPAPLREFPSAETTECIETGIVSGLRQLRLRPRFLADTAAGKSGDQSAGCKHEFLGGNERTGGVFTVICPHGICYALYIIPTAEGRDELFSFMIKYLPVAPLVVVYDHACGLHEYCLNRCPGYFKYTRFLVDRLHWFNHIACALSYWIGIYKDLDGVNSVIAEQSNSALARIERTITRTTQGPFVVLIRMFMHTWNQMKESKIATMLSFRSSTL